MKKLFLLGCIALMILTSCEEAKVENSQPVNDEEKEIIKNYTFSNDSQRFAIQLPFVQSKLRLNHERRSMYREDTYEITKQLQSMSAKYFSPDKYFIGEGRQVNEDLYNSLLRYESKENPDGLNPKESLEFTTVSGKKVKRPVVVIDLYEIDYYTSNVKDAPLAGIGFALALNKHVTVGENQSDLITEDDLRVYGENAARKLVSVIRQMPNMSQVPIFIGLYSLEKNDSTLSGGYISSGYFKSSSGDFEASKQSWILLPSTTASRNFSVFATEFDIMKRAVNDFIPEEQVGFIGQARVVNDEINYLKIGINLNGKTYLEVQGVIQFMKELIQERLTNFNFEVLCEINVLGKIQGAIHKKGNDIKVIYW